MQGRRPELEDKARKWTLGYLPNSGTTRRRLLHLHSLHNIYHCDEKRNSEVLQTQRGHLQEYLEKNSLEEVVASNVVQVPSIG
jgi:hypothetical protein